MPRQPRATARLVGLLVCAAAPASGTVVAPPPREPDELPRDDPAERRLLDELPAGFRMLHTPHFVICHDGDEAAVRPLARRVEATYQSVARFAERLALPVVRPPRKLEIVFFDEFAAYQRYAAAYGFPASQEAVGFYEPRTNRSVFFNYGNSEAIVRLRSQAAETRQALTASSRAGVTVDFAPVRALENRLARQEERVNCLIVQHEVAHQVLFNVGVHAGGQRNPRWLTEGLAMMFETPPTGGGAGLGAVNQDRLANWLKFREERRLPPVVELVGDPARLMPDHPDALAAYAQAWALVHYLQRNRSRELAGYLESIRERTEDRLYSAQEERATFEKAFGPLNERFVSTFERRTQTLPFKPGEAGL